MKLFRGGEFLFRMIFFAFDVIISSCMLLCFLGSIFLDGRIRLHLFFAGLIFFLIGMVWFGFLGLLAKRVGAIDGVLGKDEKQGRDSACFFCLFFWVLRFIASRC